MTNIHISLKQVYNNLCIFIFYNVFIKRQRIYQLSIFRSSTQENRNMVTLIEIDQLTLLIITTHSPSFGHFTALQQERKQIKSNSVPTQKQNISNKQKIIFTSELVICNLQSNFACIIVLDPKNSEELYRAAGLISTHT